MEIYLQIDVEKGIIIIQDIGIGMIQEELVFNLGIIVRLGLKVFLDMLQNQVEVSGKIIGQFGVGFYLVFMVVDRVEVYFCLVDLGSLGYWWFLDGFGVFEIVEVLGVRIGIKIIIYLKFDCMEFVSEVWV